MATSCDDDEENSIFGTQKFRITAAPTLHVNDTIWLDSWYSSHYFRKKDSIFDDNNVSAAMTFLKLRPELNGKNAVLADGAFEIIEQTGNFTNDLCPDPVPSGYSSAVLSADQKLYRTKIGLRLLQPGDFVWIVNSYRNISDWLTPMNTALLQNYPLSGGRDLDYFSSCGGSSYDVENGFTGFCFTVE